MYINIIIFNQLIRFVTAAINMAVVEQQSLNEIIMFEHSEFLTNM